MMEGIPNTKGVLGAQMSATLTASLFALPIHLMLTTIEVMANKTICLMAAIVFLRPCKYQ